MFKTFLEILAYKAKFLIVPLKNSYLYYHKLLPDSYRTVTFWS